MYIFVIPCASLACISVSVYTTLYRYLNHKVCKCYHLQEEIHIPKLNVMYVIFIHCDFCLLLHLLLLLIVTY